MSAAKSIDHYCSPVCSMAQEPCVLCLKQRRKQEEETAREANKPTLRHNPFEKLLARR
jgi:hypothetical protein